ncbi:hypothetical protein SAMN05421786_108203 [Chryseobacterium ureilyticum]|uniref:Uncharacterized protein n=1 Tax=Chryseobacterium ureilyticum TaxID=373668 RepID=A0A1N7QBH9_9FLAO|nr:hypothetical protein [Chryseobacterium ureilyticum]SIT20136.1 hypothetical protein SAMN05421786_108203 [Chryseobacterium ureilyticum]
MEIGKEYMYNTAITGRTKVHSLDSNYKINIKTSVIYKGKDPDEDYHIFEITETDYELEMYEDPLIVQITEMTNKVCSIYNTLELGINKKGEIAKIYNGDMIREKWKGVKEWLTNAHPIEAYEIIRAKEYELTNEEMEIKSIRYIHFIYQFFYIFGKEPMLEGSKSYLKREDMDRFGAGVVIPINLSVSERETEQGFNEWNAEGKMIRDEKMIRRLREFAKDNFMHPEYQVKGKYLYDDRILLKSDFTITEKLGEFFYYHCYMDTHLEL